MHLCPKTLLTAAILLVAFSAIAQERYRPPDPDLMARLSYDNSGVVQHGNLRHVCIAISRDGEYRIVRSLPLIPTERLHGKMPKEEFSQLAKLLGASEFRNLSGDHGSLILQESERFAAEIPLGDRGREAGAREWPEHEAAWHLQWLNADGESPFPASVSKLVDWLQGFQPKDAKSFEYAEYPDVCPAGGLRLLQPSVAENSHP
jgi:hypothetical protein